VTPRFPSGVDRGAMRARLESPRVCYATPGVRIGTTRASRQRQLPTKRCHAARLFGATRAYQPDSSSQPLHRQPRASVLGNFCTFTPARREPQHRLRDPARHSKPLDSRSFHISRPELSAVGGLQRPALDRPTRAGHPDPFLVRPAVEVAASPVFFQESSQACKDLADLIEFALFTGMRRGEVLRLTWERVDRARGVVLPDVTKNGRRREVPLNGRADAVLARRGSKGLRSGLRDPALDHSLCPSATGTSHPSTSAPLSPDSTQPCPCPPNFQRKVQRKRVPPREHCSRSSRRSWCAWQESNLRPSD
jgi:integrase